MKILVNGAVCDAHAASVSVQDHGFLYGVGLFETFRTYDGHSFLLEEHLQRLRAGCVHLGIAWKHTTADIEEQVQLLLAVNELSDAYIRLTVSAGEAALGMPEGPYESPVTIMHMKRLPLNGAWQDPVQLGRSLQRLQLRRNTPEGQTRFKSLNFMNNVLAKRELQTYPWAEQAEGLLLTRDDYLAEGIVSNIFFIQDQRLYTPSVETGILPGVTRQFVLNLAAKCGLTCEEGLYTWVHLLQADEIFITNSIQEITPILQLFDERGEAKVVGENVGKWTTRLIHAYRDYIGGR